MIIHPACVYQRAHTDFTCHPLTDHSVCTPQSQDNRPLTGTKLCCLMTEVYGCEKLAQSFYAMVPGCGSQVRHATATPRRHLLKGAHVSCAESTFTPKMLTISFESTVSTPVATSGTTRAASPYLGARA